MAVPPSDSSHCRALWRISRVECRGLLFWRVLLCLPGNRIAQLLHSGVELGGIFLIGNDVGHAMLVSFFVDKRNTKCRTALPAF